MMVDERATANDGDGVGNSEIRIFKDESPAV